MTPVASTLLVIHSLSEINAYQNLEKEQTGILVLDIDDTLVKEKKVLGNLFIYWINSISENFQDFPGTKDGFLYWYETMRDRFEQEACEKADLVNSVINAFRKKGWFVKVLTSRPLNFKLETIELLKRERIDISEEDIIFCDQQKKSGKFQEWLQESGINQSNLRVLCVDDSSSHCCDMEALTRSDAKSVYTSFHYRGADPKRVYVTEEEKKLLIVQLKALKDKTEIPYNEPSYEVIEAAKTSFEINDLSDQTLFGVVKSMASKAINELQI